MSYAHTKRRKLIAQLKRKNPAKWQELFRRKIDADVRVMEGSCLGSLATILQTPDEKDVL